MDKLIKLTKDVWEFGCKGDVIRLSTERLQALEAKAEALGQGVYEEVKEAATAAERAAVATEAEVVADAPKVADAVETAVKDVKAKVTKK